MKSLFLSLAALVAVSGAALASDRSFELRDSNTYFGKFSTQNKAKNNATDSNALVIVKGGKKKLTAFERVNLISKENGRDSYGSDHGSQN